VVDDVQAQLKYPPLDSPDFVGGEVIQADD
jgi:hypothetical protein